MSGETPELTPAEQQQEDEGRVQGQLVVTDVTRQMQVVMETFGFGGSGSSGRTSFEGHQLNALIDLIENSKPEDLEDAGQALLKARTSINDAAQELGNFIKGVEWEGESGVAFREWGTGLVAHAEKLGEFAQTAGTQITVAGTGLASVRSSLPPRDSRLIRKAPDDIESPAQIEANPEYAAAVKVEKDRQEAINQANRLASYYAVSEETLAGQEPPRFDKKLDVDMPRPQGYRLETETPASGASGGSGSSGGGVSESATRHSTSSGQGSAVNSNGYETPAAVEPVLDKNTSVEINSVAPPPPPVTTPSTPSTPPTTGPTAPGGGPTSLMLPGPVNPMAKGSSRGLQGMPNAPRTISQTGNSGTRSGGGPATNGRSQPPMGRPSSMQGGSSSGTTGRAGGGTQSPNAGRSGITGGRPTPTNRAGTPGATSPRGGRGGIVGGTPQRAVPGAGASGGARGVPRGTVIGAGGANNAARPAGRGTPSTKGVVGTPRGGAVRPGAGAKGFTSGGAGLVRGPAGRKDSGDEDQDDGTQRPDYLTEDRETWEAGRRGSAPPVIE
uniref:WXG100 family type VII secretion target n=1 Tax=Streptomyces sp. NBC_01401 TaxID=2903854 RepID=A0AAU3GTA4_9ACTN